MKVCPLKFNVNTLDESGDSKLNTCLCESENCEWWLLGRKMCALKALAVLTEEEVIRKKIQ